METTEKIVLGVLENFVPEDKRHRLSLESDFRKDLGLDSFKLINMVFELRSKTNFEISQVDYAELKQMTTVQDIVTVVNKQIKLN